MDIPPVQVVTRAAKQQRCTTIAGARENLFEAKGYRLSPDQREWLRAAVRKELRLCRFSLKHSIGQLVRGQLSIACCLSGPLKWRVQNYPLAGKLQGTPHTKREPLSCSL